MDMHILQLVRLVDDIAHLLNSDLNFFSMLRVFDMDNKSL